MADGWRNDLTEWLAPVVGLLGNRRREWKRRSFKATLSSIVPASSRLSFAFSLPSSRKHRVSDMLAVA